MMRQVRHSILFAVGWLTAIAGAQSLEEGFAAPPHDAKPQTWWHWMNGNVSKEGITADLEAMAEVGLGGAQIFDAGCGIPAGPVAFNSPEWFDAVAHAAKEARRLGLELCLANCSGWTSSGGPWITPDKSMKFLAHTETEVAGPLSPCRVSLAQPPDPHGFYEDIAVFAYPVPAASEWSMTNEGAKVSVAEGIWTVRLPRPVKLSGFSCRFDWPYQWCAAGAVRVEVADAEGDWRLLEECPVTLAVSGHGDKGVRFIPFSKRAEARCYRFMPRFDAGLGVQMADLSVEKKLAVSDLPVKTFRLRAPVDSRQTPWEADQVVDKARVVDLTERLAADGSLAWDVPEGRWRIVRLGYAANGRCNAPASKFGVGLEVDKLSKEAVDFHFETYVGKLCRMLGPLAGNHSSGVNNVLIDSYEVGSQNWTKGFEKEFVRRRGYEMLPYYPVFTGAVVGSPAETERFLSDFRRTVADMFAENYAGEMMKKCHEYGLQFSLEPYGSCPSDNLQYGRYADIPMGEFWSIDGTGIKTTGNARFPGYLAHVWGRRYAATESFTGGADEGKGTSRWQRTPFGIKAQGDRVYAEGVNRIIYHQFTHQPWAGDTYRPGMTMGRFGIHFNRMQTWWKQAKDWIAYQSRCQFLLQEGKVVAEGLFYAGEEAPNDGGNTDGAVKPPPSLPYGYNWDICSRDALMELKTDDRGRVVAPGGVAYNLLILPESESMSLEVLRKIDALLEDGAHVVGPVKPVHTPGLAGYPAVDGELRALADRVWARPNLHKESPGRVLEKLAIAPDFAWQGKKGDALTNTDVAYIHRDYGAQGEGYFVAMPNAESTTVDVSFRQTGRLPELWDPETGTRMPAPVWREEDGRTRVRLDFRPSGSMFVMFRRKAGNESVTDVRVKARKTADPVEKAPSDWERRWPESPMRPAESPDMADPLPDCALDVDGEGRTRVLAYRPLQAELVLSSGATRTVAAEVPPARPVEGPWTVRFPAGWGAPEKTEFARLTSWPENLDDGIRYFSGTAVYEKTLPRPEAADGTRLILDLGVVKDFAEVEVNGVRYPVLWKPPFRLDITDAAAHGDELHLRIRVTNRWMNRLIGDDRLYGEDCQWKNDEFRQSIVDLPQWVKDGKKSPSGRHTFTTWKHWNAGDALFPSGLLGPVYLRTAVYAQ